jgi:hypothetical protein
MFRTTVCVAAFLGCAVSASAQLKPGAPVFVVNIFDPTDPKATVVRADSFNQALARPNDPASPLSMIVDACTPAAPAAAAVPAPAAPAAATGSAESIIDRLDLCADCLRGFQERRYITERGDEVLLIVLFDSQASSAGIRPVFQETPRDSELLATAKALRKLLDVAKESRGAACRIFYYTLQRKRSFLKVTVPIPAELYQVQRAREAAQAAARAGAPASPAGNVLDPGARPATADVATAPPDRLDTPEVTLGPVERWFLSADFTIAKASVELAATPTPDTEALESKDFFIGLNFALSDLLADRDSPLQRRSLLHELVIKVQATPSWEPWTSWAVGVGVRGYRVRTLLWNMDIVHPFVAFGRQSVIEGEGSRWRAVFGLGFDPRAINRE